jgi:site-specific recombinase XerD
MKKISEQAISGLTNYSYIELMDNYFFQLEALSRSPKTISWYKEILIRYFNFLKSHGLLKPVNKLGTKELIDYITHLQQSAKWLNNPHIKNKGRLSQFTVTGHVRAIKAFWGWLYDEGYLDANSLAKFPMPKVPKNMIKVLSIEHIKKLLNVVDKHTTKGFRLYCIIMLLLDTGLRISELVGIRMTGIDMIKSWVKVTGKGQKERLVLFSKITRKELQKYIKYYRQDLCNQESPYLFPEAGGGHISVNSIQQAIRRLAKKAGLKDVKCHPHIFRHTFATMFLANGGADVALKEIMGHESFQTTQKYIHLQPQDLQKQHMKYSPVLCIFGD